MNKSMRHPERSEGPRERPLRFREIPRSELDWHCLRGSDDGVITQAIFLQ